MRKLFFLLPLLIVLFGLAPQESAAQRKSTVSPRTGIWQISGKDEENTRWKGQIRFTRKTNLKSAVRYKGYFSWYSTDGKTVGREYFRGLFNKSSGRLKLTGYAVKNVRGVLAKGTYTAQVGQRGRRLKRGRWNGIEVAKGIWSAKWLRDK